MWNYGDWGWMGYGMHGWGMFLVWGLIILAVVALVRSMRSPHPTNVPSLTNDPVNILRERYARGELNRDEFQDMRDQLNAS